jgi:hypothetical protein
MRTTYLISAIVLVGLLCAPPLAWGQMQRSGGMPGMSSPGMSSPGMFSANPMSSRSPGMGASPFGNSMGMSPFGSSMGMSPFGSSMGSPFGNSSSMSPYGNSMNRNGQPGFVGVNPNNGFIGVNPNMMNGMNPNMMNSMNPGMSRNNMMPGQMRPGQMRPGMNNNMFNPQMRPGQGMNANAATVRTQLTVGFQGATLDSQKVSSSITKRLADLPAVHWSSPGRVEMQGRTAILRGVVATQHDRDLAERVIRLEPGVGDVENQLVVASNSTSAQSAETYVSPAPAQPAPANTATEPAAANSPPAQ